jgi:Sulfotransferase family
MVRSATFNPQPDAAALLAQAEYETGLHDFGRRQFRGSLGAFVHLVNSAGQLGADDRRAAFGQMVRVLGWRLRLVEDRKRYPGIADERIEAPLIVVGFPRSGTTLLHALLAGAPGNRAPLYWEIARPSPPPSLAAPGDPRIAEGTRDIERWLADYGGFIAQHPYFDAGGQTPMECESLLVYDLRNAYPTMFSKVPFGHPWAEEQSDEEYYASHQDFLQHLQFGGPRRRWVLKGVEHQFRLSALLAAYPDARLVWPHRDPVEVFGSLLAVTSMVFQHSGAPAPADRRAFSLAMLDRFQQRGERALADPASGSDSVCHVSYADLVADPATVVQTVYKHFDLPPVGVEPAVRAWLDDPGNRADRFGKWTYDLADHQVSADEVRDRFGSYRERFGV